MTLNYLALSGLITFISTFIGALFVFLNNPKKAINQIWAIFSFLISFWGFGIFKNFSVDDYTKALFWARFLNTIAILIMPFLFHFCCAFTGKNQEKKKELKLYYAIGFIYFFISVFFVKYFVPDVHPVLNFKYYASPSYLYFIFPAYYLFLFIYGVKLLIQKYILATGHDKNRIKYVLLGIGLTLVGGSTTFPAVFNIPFPPIGVFLAPVYIYTVIYAVIQYRVLDIDIAWRYILSYMLYGLISIFGLIELGIFLNKKNIDALTIILTISMISSIITPMIYKYTTALSERILLKKYNKIWNKLKNLAEDKKTRYKLKDILSIITNDVANVLNLKNSHYYILEDQDKAYKIFSYNSDTPSQLIRMDSPIIEYLNKEKTKIYKEELLHLPKHKKLISTLNDLEYEICFPIFFQTNLIGIVCYGTKKDNTIYHKQELEYLENIIEKTQNDIINAKMVEFFSEKSAKESKHQYDIELHNSFEQLEKIKSIPEFCEAVDNLLYQAIKSCGVAIYLYNDKTEKYEYQKIEYKVKKERRHNIELHDYNKLNPLHKNIQENSDIISYLKEYKEVLKLEDIEKWAQETKSKELKSTANLLKNIQGRLIGSLFQTNFLGFIIIGEQENNKEYSTEDIKKIEFLLKMATLTLNNLTLKEKALKDTLMGLYNKGYLHKRLQEEIVYTTKEGKPLSFLMIDIDHFKIFNTNIGHLEADEVLKTMGEYLNSSIRSNDEAFRYGGEEICVILPNTNNEEAENIAKRFNADVKQKKQFLDLAQKHKLGITISIGVSTLFDKKIIDDLSNRETKILKDKLIETADDFLYIAKNSGRDQVQTAKQMTREELIIRPKNI